MSWATRAILAMTLISALIAWVSLSYFRQNLLDHVGREIGLKIRVQSIGFNLTRQGFALNFGHVQLQDSMALDKEEIPFLTISAPYSLSELQITVDGLATFYRENHGGRFQNAVWDSLIRS